ncbi:MAG: alpha-amylase family glycosyl hydrolase [Ignavibacteriaceae bacterium]
MLRIKIVFLFFIVLSIQLFAIKITLHDKSATVWLRNQTIVGNIDTLFNTKGTLFINSSKVSFLINSADSSFSIPIIVGKEKDTIFVEVDNGSTKIFSDTIIYSLGYKVSPEIYAYASVTARNIYLHAITIDNPDTSILYYSWSADTSNPYPVALIASSDSLASISMSQYMPLGEYYFNLLITTSTGDTSYARTLVTLDTSGIKPFNIATDHAAWIDKAVIYGITPYIFVNGGTTWDNITNKIPDLIRLGINTIWLQPIFATYGGGQGYDIIDYFKLRSDLGTEMQFANLIKTAKSYGLKILFDIPINHTSLYHPYAQNTILYGTDSHYYHFYQRAGDNMNVPYSEDYVANGGFINYFWSFPNLYYDNPEVQRWITEVCKYWIKKYNIDGYRFDAIWGVNSRDSNFTQQLRLSLKRLKPDILMLAEDKATHAMVFNNRFDAAYDWTAEESWVSHWSWQTNYDPNNDPTIFNNSNQNNRSALLRAALTNNGNGFAPNAKVLHFMENNDTQRFIAFHSLAQTKMVAALMFSLNGIPLIYNGQEIGDTDFPYTADHIFYPGLPINYNDPNQLFPYYQSLINLRKSIPALNSDNYSEVSVTPNNYVFAFRRWQGNQNVFCLINMGNASVSIPVDKMNLDSTKNYYLTDMLNGNVISGTIKDFSSINIPINAFTSRLFLFADTIMTVTGVKTAELSVPAKFQLGQNYPNPFNPSTTINFSLPFSGFVSLKVFDLLGRKVATLVNENKSAGNYTVQFNGLNFASGIYFYRIEFGGNAVIKKMMMIK